MLPERAKLTCKMGVSPENYFFQVFRKCSATFSRNQSRSGTLTVSPIWCGFTLGNVGGGNEHSGRYTYVACVLVPEIVPSDV